MSLQRKIFIGILIVLALLLLTSCDDVSIREDKFQVYKIRLNNSIEGNISMDKYKYVVTFLATEYGERLHYYTNTKYNIGEIVEVCPKRVKEDKPNQ